MEEAAMKRSSQILAVLAILLASGAARADYVITDLGIQSDAAAINRFGQVAGSTTFAGSQFAHAFLYNNGIKQDLGTLAGGMYSSVAYAINNSGQVVGISNLTPTVTHAFLYSGGAMRDLGTLGGVYSTATGINAAGQVVGYATLDPSPNTTTLHAFLYSGGVMRDLGTLGGSVSFANGINDAGQIVGRSTIRGDTADHAFLYSSGAMRDLGTLGGNSSVATAINNLGHVVGYSDTATETHAFLYSDGVLHDLGTLGGISSHALALNDSGAVVGFATTAAGDQRAFLFSDGALVDLNSLLPSGSSWQLLEATGINDSGQIVGNGIFNGQTHGFLLTPQAPAPVPEPGTLSLVAAALGGLFAYGAMCRKINDQCQMPV
jgi:probable HAF family extracellular repeat protein